MYIMYISYAGCTQNYIEVEPVHICSRYKYPVKCSRNKFSEHERSHYEQREMFSAPYPSDLKSAHTSVCAL